jgi:nitric oxide dioxygenase
LHISNMPTHSLSADTRNLVKGTAPILKTHGLALTKHFYARMFEHNPELKQIFNQGNQQSSAQQQALAMAVAAYADHIDNPGVLLPVLKLVANKHVSLGIRAEHYPVVGKHLIASIREVLGATAATDDLLAAWTAAYGQLAQILIDLENSLYLESTQKEGGWSGWRGFVVHQKEVESEEITSFYLRPQDGGKLPRYAPGQYVSVRVFCQEIGLIQPRQYSLSTAPSNEIFRISVKREQGNHLAPSGLISNHLHSNVQVGDTLDISPPMGNFFLHEERRTPVVLLSAGVGLTPLVAMLEQLMFSLPKRQVHFIHACRHGGVHAMKGWVQQAVTVHAHIQSTVFYEAPRDHDLLGADYDYAGRIDLAKLPEYALAAESDYYVCGPLGFMKAQKTSLHSAGVPSNRVHLEAFGVGGANL